MVLSTLALQCFTNEYLYFESDRDTEALDALENRVRQGLENKVQPSPLAVMCLASFRTLNSYSWHGLLSLTDDLDRIWKRQILDFKTESAIRSKMPVLKKISDTGSLEVRAQYEKHPYPRWTNLKVNLIPQSIYDLATDNNLRIFDKKIFNCEKPQILVAGCGTGQHAIQTATRFKNCDVLAVDLSLRSLCYAKRQTQEMGIKNIEYLQADILDLQQLGRKFDIIESFGVLHHMSNPSAGLKVLTSCLNPSGVMMISLYSALAREKIAAFRESLKIETLNMDNSTMKSLRKQLILSSDEHCEGIINSPDFFSLGSLRDLLFHVKEHNFTLNQVNKLIYDEKLKFCGFEAKDIVEKFSLTAVSSDELYDLEKWHMFELENPKIFGATDGFWCQKVS